MKKHLLTLLLLSSLVACAGEKAAITISVNPFIDNVQIHSTYVKDWLNQESYDYSDMDAHVNARTDLGDNFPLEITWNTENLPNNKTVKYVVKFVDNNSQDGLYETNETKVNFINYKLNTKYQMIIAVEFDKKVQYLDTFEITTPDGYFRTITIDGVNNFRDLGDGKLIKQGLIYRSATLENNTSIDEDNPVSISELGRTQLGYLQIVSEIDLRKDEEKAITDGSVVGLNYLKAPLHYGGNNILTYNQDDYHNPETIKNIFEFLGNKDNYPVDFHCVRGTDRTGCIAFLIKALMGYDWEALYRDFLFSNFYNIGSPVKKDNVYYEKNPATNTRYGNVIDNANGESLKEKTYNYLSSDAVGVKTETLDSIINILKA